MKVNTRIVLFRYMKTSLSLKKKAKMKRKGRIYFNPRAPPPHEKKPSDKRFKKI